jgi:hypothetical protein
MSYVLCLTTAGLGYLELNVLCPCQISPLGGCLVSALSIPIRENGTIPLLTLTLITITSMQLQTSKLPDYLTSTPPYNPQAQLLYTKCIRLDTNL